MKKTTVYLEVAAYARLKQLARSKRRTPASLVREAVVEYTERHASRTRARSVGAFKSSRRDLGSAAESLLEGLGEDR